MPDRDGGLPPMTRARRWPRSVVHAVDAGQMYRPAERPVEYDDVAVDEVYDRPGRRSTTTHQPSLADLPTPPTVVHNRGEVSIDITHGGAVEHLVVTPMSGNTATIQPVDARGNALGTPQNLTLTADWPSGTGSVIVPMGGTIAAALGDTLYFEAGNLTFSSSGANEAQPCSCPSCETQRRRSRARRPTDLSAPLVGALVADEDPGNDRLTPDPSRARLSDMPATITPADVEIAVANINYDIDPTARHRNARYQVAAYLWREAPTSNGGRRRTLRQVADFFGFINTNAAQHACYYGALGVGAATPTRRTGRTTPARSSAPVYAGEAMLLARRFGVEVEYNGGYDQGPTYAARAINAAGVPAHAESYNHSTPNGYWKCTTDATVSGGEVVSPPLTGDQGWAEMREVMRAIKSIGGSVGSNCGTHVHHDLTDFSTTAQMETLIANLEVAQDAILMYVRPGRLTGTWCHKLSSAEFAELMSRARSGSLRPVNHRSSSQREYGCGVDRYRAFNFNSTLVYGTVEFRAHSGSLNAMKMRPWIAMGQAIIEFSRQGHRLTGRQSVRGLVATLVGAGVLNESLGERFKERCAEACGQAALVRLENEVASVAA